MPSPGIAHGLGDPRFRGDDGYMGGDDGYMGGVDGYMGGDDGGGCGVTVVIAGMVVQIALCGEIVPIWVDAFDKLDLPVPVPLFNGFFSLYRFKHAFVRFVIDQAGQAVSACEAELV